MTVAHVKVTAPAIAVVPATQTRAVVGAERRTVTSSTGMTLTGRVSLALRFPAKQARAKRPHLAGAVGVVAPVDQVLRQNRQRQP